MEPQTRAVIQLDLPDTTLKSIRKLGATTLRRILAARELIPLSSVRSPSLSMDVLTRVLLQGQPVVAVAVVDSTPVAGLTVAQGRSNASPNELVSVTV
jgi:hypothetical protein